MDVPPGLVAAIYSEPRPQPDYEMLSASREARQLDGVSLHEQEGPEVLLVCANQDTEWFRLGNQLQRGLHQKIGKQPYGPHQRHDLQHGHIGANLDQGG